MSQYRLHIDIPMPFTEEEAMKAISAASKTLGLPVCDPVRQGAGVLFDAIEKYKESLK